MHGLGRGSLVVAVTTAIMLGLALPASALSYKVDRLTDEAAEQVAPRMSGDKIVWLDMRTGAGGDLWCEDLVTGNEFYVTNTPSTHETRPDIDGDLVVWEDYRGADADIYMYDIPTGHERGFVDPGWQGMPAVSGDRVVYCDDQSGDLDVYLYNWQMRTLERLTDDTADQQFPDISGDKVVWADDRGGDYDIYLFDWNTRVESALVTAANDQLYPRIHGDIVVWYDNRNGSGEIWMHDLSSGQEKMVSDSTDHNWTPDVGEDYVTWGQNVFDPDTMAYSVLTGVTTTIAPDPAWQLGQCTSGGHIAWNDSRNHAGFYNDIYMADLAISPKRSAGDDRYGTAVDIVRDHPTFEDHTAVIATGEDFPDALAAAGLAGMFDAPLFLVKKDSVPAEVANELARRKVDWVIIVGGEPAVSSNVESWLKARHTGVFRLWGTDRYGTAQAVAEYMNMVFGGGGLDRVLIARGDLFPDALALSPIAYARNMPILLTRPDSLSAATKSALQNVNATSAAIAGSEKAVSAVVKTDIDAVLIGNGGPGSFRWSGADRYGTAAAVAKEAVAIDWLNSGFVGLATGLDFPDALAGGIAAGEEHGVVLLTKPDDLPSAAAQFLSQHEQGICSLHGFGGANVLSDAVLGQAATIVNQ